MEHHLKPIPNVPLRCVVLVILLVPLFVGPATWLTRLFVIAMLTTLVGSYRNARLRGGRFETGLAVGFVPLRIHKWSLRRFVQIEVDMEDGAGWGVFLLFGPLQFVMCYMLDWLFPWFGGRYQIWLRGVKGKRILVWQGSSDTLFQENLRYLETVSGLPVERAG